MRLAPFAFLAAAVAAPAVTAASIKPGTALYTNAVTYCAEAKAVLIDAFDISYWRANNSVTFMFSFASVESNLNVSANVYLNDYGNTLFNETFQLCSFFEGVLCPLPQVNFTGYGTYPLPSSLTGSIPSLAWTVPNLEAYARVELLNIDTGDVAACLQATLSNGWSTQWTGVKWASAGLTLAALLVGLFHAVIDSPSPAQYRWFDVLSLFQTAAACGLLHLNYPLVYSNFAQNFAWSLGLLTSAGMQDSIDTMRDKTGGHLSGTAYNEVQYINRQLSPYNVDAIDINEALSTVASLNALITDTSTSNTSNTAAVVARELISRATIPSAVDQNATSELTTGIPVYVESDAIPEANAFDTVFFNFLAFCAIVLAVHAVLYLLTLLVDRASARRGAKSGTAGLASRTRGTRWAGRLRRTWWSFCAGNALRVCLIFLTPVFIFGFYQWTIGRSDSGLSLFFSILTMLIIFVPFLTALVLSLLRARRPSPTSPDVSPLYTSLAWFHSVGALYRPYKQRYHFFWFPLLVLAAIARAGFIGFGQGNAWAQVIGCMVVEFIVLVTLILFRPHKDKKGDWLSPFLSFCRLAAFGLLVAFIEGLKVKAIPRTIIGIVMIAVFGIPTVLLFFGLLFNLGYGILWARKVRRVEDGLEVDRDLAAEDDASDRPAMVQTQPGLSPTDRWSALALGGTDPDRELGADPESGAGVYGTDFRRRSVNESGSVIASGATSLARRTSVLEPVEYEGVESTPQGTPPTASTTMSPTSPTNHYGLGSGANTASTESASAGLRNSGAGYNAVQLGSPLGANSYEDEESEEEVRGRVAAEEAYAELARGGGGIRRD